MSALAQVMAAAEQAAREPDWAATEAPGPDGLLRCTVCGGKRQTAVTLLPCQAGRSPAGGNPGTERPGPPP